DDGLDPGWSGQAGVGRRAVSPERYFYVAEAQEPGRYSDAGGGAGGQLLGERSDGADMLGGKGLQVVIGSAVFDVVGVDFCAVGCLQEMAPLRSARTDRTRRLSSEEGGCASLLKMLLMRLLPAVSVM